MSKIIFQGKTLSTNEWVYGGYAAWNGRHFIMCSDELPVTWLNYEVHPSSVGRFTEQFDKAGDPIYEGDIVYVPSEDEYADISWDSHAGKFLINFDGWCSNFDHFSGKDLEIRGNTFDEGWYD